MSTIDSAIDELGRSMGMDGLSFEDKNFIQLNISNHGDLFFEKCQDEDNNETLSVYLVRELKFPTLATYRKALEICHLREGHEIPITAGLQGESNLAFITHFSSEQATLPNIELAINKLQEAHKRTALK